MSKAIFWIGFISFVFAVIFGILLWYGVRVGCVDYLKLAGDAPNVQKADEFLGKALEYMELNNLTSGNSAFIFHTPSADVGIWYGQIKGAKKNLEGILERLERKREKQEPISQLDQLEQDNALMRVKEVVLDQGENGTEVVKPPNLMLFPYQWITVIWWIITVILLLVGGGIWWWAETQQ